MEPTTIIDALESLVLPLLGLGLVMAFYPKFFSRFTGVKAVTPFPRPATEEEKREAKEFVRAEMERQERAFHAQLNPDQCQHWTPPPVPLAELEADILARWTDWQLTQHLVPPEPGTPQFAADQVAFMAVYLRTASRETWRLRSSTRPQVQAVTRNGALLPPKPAT